MAFSYLRTIHFSDTDAAGVVFFANYLAICHEAYEEALGAAGIELKTFFADTGVVVPITRSEAEYLRPLACGEKIRVKVHPELLTEATYAVRYEVTRLGPVEKLAARVRTEHVCIATQSRERRPLPPPLAAWVRGG
ncbi:MAG TPA: thioesterase family protein [Opitutaceae bacterium]|nr:thioesterase family protein [Opitutaceae bacterium]